MHSLYREVFQQRQSLGRHARMDMAATVADLGTSWREQLLGKTDR